MILLETNNLMPLRATEHSAGIDLRIPEAITINPRESCKIKLGVRVASMPTDMEARIKSRSSVFAKGIIIDGTIDADYKKEIWLVAWNVGKQPVTFQQGERVAQIKFSYVATNTVKIAVNKWNDDDYERGGLGSTGR